MISDFDFYRFPRTKVQRTRIVKKSSGSAIETYKFHSVTGIKHSDVDDFSITVPTFANWRYATYVKSDRLWYTVENCVEDIRDKSKLRFDLAFDPILTLTYDGSHPIKALWKKLPFASDKAKTGTVLDESNLIETKKDDLATMEWQDTTVLPTIAKYSMFWVEITTSCSLLGAIDPDTGTITTVDNRSAIEKSVNQQSTLFKYGFFTVYDKGRYVPRIQLCDHKINNYKLSEWWNNGTLEQHTITDYDLFYPSLDDVINDPDEVLGIPTDSILDVSITAWCPYKYHTYSHTEDGVVYSFPMLDNEGGASLYPFIIRNANVKTKPTVYGKYSEHPRHIAYYELGSTNESFYSRDEWDSHTLKITMDEYVCGTIYLRDANGNQIVQIPRDYFEFHYNYISQETWWQLDYKAQTYSDSTGLYTRVDIGKNGIPHIIVFPEGKLPFIGDAWAQYRIRDMSYDRQALENTKEQAMLGAVAGIGDTIVNTATTLALGALAAPVTGGLSMIPAVATAGGSILSTATNTALEMRAADQEQALTEARQKGAAGTGFNTGYGITYCDNAIDIGSGFMVMMPSRFDAPDAHSQGEYYGYNANFVGTYYLEGHDGYCEGVLADQITLGGGTPFPPVWCDRLAEMLLNGVRIQRI